MVSYVVGLMFSEDRLKVALIKKQRPSWQQGRLNGIGGKIEPNETADQCMRREFLEETGYNNPHWEPVASMYVREDLDVLASVTFYRSFGDLSLLKTTTDEKILICDVVSINSLPIIDNLKFIIPMCLNDHLIWPQILSVRPQNNELSAIKGRE